MGASEARVEIMHHENTPHVTDSIAATSSSQATLTHLEGSSLECATSYWKPVPPLPSLLATPCFVSPLKPLSHSIGEPVGRRGCWLPLMLAA